MKKAIASAVAVLFFGFSSAAAACEPGHTAAGFGIGIVLGTLLLPGIGTILAGVLAGGGTCVYGALTGGRTIVAQRHSYLELPRVEEAAPDRDL